MDRPALDGPIDAAGPLTRRALLRYGLQGSAAMFAILAAGRGGVRESHAQGAAKKLTGPLNVLAWEGYDDPAIVKPFEDKHGVKVNVKVVSGNNVQLDQIRAGAIQFDVANPDATWVETFAKSGLLEPINAADYPNLQQMFKPFRQFAPNHFEGKLYGVPIRWGINGIVHWPDKLSVADAADGNSLWDKKFKGRISHRDWYDLHILLTGLYMGYKKPWTLDGDDLAKVTKRLVELKPNIRAIHLDSGGVKTDLANGDAWIVWGSSSNDVTTTLKLAGKNVVLTIPKQGGAVWTEALSMVKGAKNVETAKAYLDYMTTAETQAKMAWSKNKKIAVCNEMVKNHLTAEQFKTLDLDKAEQWVGESVMSEAPVNNEAWKKAWQQYKSA